MIECDGRTVHLALENGVSMYPKLEGRFPQVAGLEFAFDPSKPSGHRIDPKNIKIQKEYLDFHRVNLKKKIKLICNFIFQINYI